MWPAGTPLDRPGEPKTSRLPASDHGGEFAKHFADSVREAGISHWHT
ncbi:MAG: hypothetical protein ABIP64_18440 [Burkholderiales bacterium]